MRTDIRRVVHKVEVVHRKPQLATAILVVGAGAYWMLCEPAIGRRGYPEIDPFWLAMPKLWILPVLLSAIWEDRRRHRLVHLLFYALVTGFIANGTIVTLIPNHCTYADMLLATVWWGPLHFIVAMVLEGMSQRLLLRVRRFDDSPRCLRCGYNLLHLIEPRCPECGQPFDPAWLEWTHSDSSLAVRSCRSWAVAIALLLFGAVFPLGYRLVRLEYAALRGMLAAEEGWREGSAKWYATPAEELAIMNEYAASGTAPWSLVHEGMEIRLMHGGIEDRIFQKAYREVIEGKLGSARTD